MCELYDELMSKSEKEIKEMTQKQMQQKMPIDVVIMDKCTDHCYHKECLQNQQGKADCIRCAICSNIYGVLTGSMPTGTMQWQYMPVGQMPCDGFENEGTWLINYAFPNGKQANGVAYRGTGR